MSDGAGKLLLVTLLAMTLSGCSLGYYLHSARGQADLLARRTPIAEVIADPATPAALRERLELVSRARIFASETLGLPAKKGYRSYAELDRPYAVWNVVATPEFSLEPIEWCFPVAGCVSYRGYFSEAKARTFASRLRAQGHDVAIRGVAAYSTLGYFDDPVLNTMMHWDDVQLISIIFHELAHQLLYVKGDTPFNESFASIVEQEGMRRWTQHIGNESALESYAARRAERRCFNALVEAARLRLQEIFQRSNDPAALRAGKATVFDDLSAEYRRAEKNGLITKAYATWFEQSLNNAHLASVAAYQKWVPALREMLVRAGGDLQVFYREAGRLSDLTGEEREEALRELGPAGDPGNCRLAPDEPGLQAASGRTQ